MKKMNGISLGDYLRVLGKRWMIEVAVFLVVVTTSMTVNLRSPNVYEASTIIKIGKIGGSTLTGNRPIESIPEIVEIFRQGSTLKEIAEDLGIPVNEGNLNIIRQRITMKERANLLQINGEGNTPEAAWQLANSVAKILLERHRQLISSWKQVLEGRTKNSRKLEDEIEDLRIKIKGLEKSTSQSEAIIALGYIYRLENLLERYEKIQRELEETKVIVSAELPRNPVRPQRKQNVLIAGFFGIFFGIMFAFIFEYLSIIFKQNPTR